MGTTHRGFIPLMAVLLLGIVATAGGTFAVMYLHEPTKEDAAEVATTTPSASILPQETILPIAETSEEVATEPARVKAKISSETGTICAEAAKQSPPSEQSLIGNIQTLCQKLDQPAEDTLEQREVWAHTETTLSEKWALWLKTQGRSE